MSYEDSEEMDFSQLITHDLSLVTSFFAAQHTSILPPCSITEGLLDLFSLIFWQLAR